MKRDPFGFHKAINWDVVDTLTTVQLENINAPFEGEPDWSVDSDPYEGDTLNPIEQGVYDDDPSLYDGTYSEE